MPKSAPRRSSDHGGGSDGPESFGATSSRRRRLTKRVHRPWAPLLVAICLTVVVGSSVPVGAAEKGTFTVKPHHGKTAQVSGTMLNGIASVNFKVPKLTSNAYLAVAMRSSGTTKAYRARVTVSPSGNMRVGFSRVAGGRETVLVTARIPGKIKAGQTLRLQGAVSDVNKVKLWVRAWVHGKAQPGWQERYTDSSAGRITRGGHVGAWAYSSRLANKSVGFKFSGLRYTTYPKLPVPTKPVPATPTTKPTGPVAAEPQTSITTGPSEGSVQSSTSGSFSVSSSLPNARFECSLDGAAFTTCGSPTSYNGLSVAKHTFQARAVVAGVTDPTPAVRTFTVSVAEPPSSGGKPSAATTGVPSGTTLTRRDGDMVITKAGTKLDRLDIHGFVIVRADNVKITNSIVRGGVAKDNIGLITNYGSKNLIVEDVDLKAAHPSVWLDGIKGSDFTATRVHVVGNVDSVKIQGDNVTVEDSLLENTTYYASDPNQGGGPTHNDNIQIQRGANIRVTGNTIRGSTNFAVLGAASTGNTPNLVVEGNWVDGGHCTIKLQILGGYSNTATVRNNKFGPNRQVRSCPFQAEPGVKLTASGNVFEDTGGAVSILRQ